MEQLPSAGIAVVPQPPISMARFSARAQYGRGRSPLPLAIGVLLRKSQHEANWQVRKVTMARQ